MRAATIAAGTMPTDSQQVLEGGKVRFGWADAVALGSIAGQMGLVLLLIYVFHMESRTFFHVSLLAGIGFVINALLPLRYRQAFFVLVSLVAIDLGFGLRGGSWLVACGCILIGLCHVPIAMRWRVVLLLAAAGVLGAMRSKVLPTPWQPSVWPILGSMFMFRIIVYLHSVRHRDAPIDLWRSLGYFFMFPNVCFPLFPVIDYQQFARNYYNEDAYVIYQRGVRWIVRGIIQLLAYRLVYYNLTLGPNEVTDLGTLLQHVLSIFPGMFLKITGSYSLIVGFLLLYGFNLPEVTHRFLLSSSFTDFWRRMYTYWKDFMTKVVYYPLFFRLRGKGSRKALVLSLIGVFVATWLFHAWQFYWMRGDLPFRWVDTAFWGLMGALVIWNSLSESGRRRQVSQPGWRAVRAFKIVGTFFGVALLLSFWYSNTFGEWFTMIGSAIHATPTALFVLAGIVLGGLALAGWNWDTPNVAGKRPSFWYRYPALQNSLTVGALLLLAVPSVTRHLGPVSGEWVASLQRSTLNKRQEQQLTRGYYEKLDNINRFDTELWEKQVNRPADWQTLGETKAERIRGDFLYYEMVPGARITFKGRPFSVNQWGMRDKDYSLVAPDSVYRIVILGSSDIMGSGVGDGEDFTALTEARLNRELHGTGYRGFEIMDLGVAGYNGLQQLEVLRLKVPQFKPDMVIMTYHAADGWFLAGHLARLYANHVAIPYPEIAALFQRAGIDSTVTSPDLFDRRMGTRTDTLNTLIIHEAAKLIDSIHATPVYAMIRLPGAESVGRQIPAEARATGFHILDLQDAFAGAPPTSFQIAEYDQHPNDRGHRALAEVMYRELTTRCKEFGLCRSAAGSPGSPAPGQ